MRLSLILSAIAACSYVALAAVPADAAPKKKTSISRSESKRVVRNRARPSSRITVTRRSYLDPGTEVYPYSKSYTDYALPVNDYPFSVVDPTGNFRGSSSLGAFGLPSYHSPFSAF